MAKRNGSTPPPAPHKRGGGAIRITGGRVIDPAVGRDERADVYVERGRIVERATSAEVEVIAADGLIVAPGLVDVHAHFRQPGREDKETIATGARAAARGGFTSVCVMPNTDPVIDGRGLVEYILAEAARTACVRVYPIAAVTRGQRGEVLTDFGDLADAGAVAFSDDGQPVMHGAHMRRALEYAGMIGKPVVAHEEDRTLSAGGVMHESLTATVMGLPGVPAAAEVVMVARDLELARLTGGHLHIAHVSAADSVNLIRQAKAGGVRVSCETAPHYIALTDEAVRGYDTNAKVNPPIKSSADRQAIIAGICDGTIDCVATDHAPHTAWEKAMPFADAPFGLVGLETALGVCATHLVHAGHLGWPAALALLSTRPAQLFGLSGGTLAPGAPADIVLIDPDRPWMVRPEHWASKGSNSPFIGMELVGSVARTLVGGATVYEAAHAFREPVTGVGAGARREAGDG